MTVRSRSSKMRVFSVDRNIFHMTFHTGFTYRNLQGFAQFPGDSTALVICPMRLARDSAATWRLSLKSDTSAAIDLSCNLCSHLAKALELRK